MLKRTDTLKINLNKGEIPQEVKLAWENYQFLSLVGSCSSQVIKMTHPSARSELYFQTNSKSKSKQSNITNSQHIEYTMM